MARLALRSGLATVLALATLAVACNSVIGVADLPITPAQDASVDAAVEAAPRFDAGIAGRLQDPALWSAFDVTSLSTDARAFVGGAFDGRFVYFSPNGGKFKPHGLVARYDTQQAFGVKSAWSLTDLTSLLADPAKKAAAQGFRGAVFDGRYVYFVPSGAGSAPSGLVIRFDSKAGLSDASAWSWFDVTMIDPKAVGFFGAVFDGAAIHFVAGTGGAPVVTYDTKSDFAAPSSWRTSSAASGTDAGVVPDFAGAVCDGHYVYFVPAQGARVTRYDVKPTSDGGSPWTSYDAASVVASGGPSGFAGGVFDGRYVYFAPNQGGGKPQSGVLRFDTKGDFTVAAAWSSFDLAGVRAEAKGYAGAVFDGRRVYFVPNDNGAASGLVAAYDTQADFGSAAAWLTFDLAKSIPTATGFTGGVFDGRFVYLVPSIGGTVARFDAVQPKQPAPGAPSFGSTL